MNGAFLSFHLLAADQTFLIHSLESVKKYIHLRLTVQVWYSLYSQTCIMHSSCIKWSVVKVLNFFPLNYYYSDFSLFKRS